MPMIAGRAAIAVGRPTKTALTWARFALRRVREVGGVRWMRPSRSDRGGAVALVEGRTSRRPATRFARMRTGHPEAMPSLTSAGQAAAAGIFGTLARLTGGRPLHPAGIAFRARLVVGGHALHGSELFGSASERRAVVRFSRGFGLPEPLPEILSIAIKVPDAYGPGRDQDLLLTATGERPILRHVFSGGRSHLDRTYSTVFRFAVGGERVLFGAVPERAGARGGEDLDELAIAAAAGGLAFDVRAATPLGPWRTIARLEVFERLAEGDELALRFNSDNAGGGIAPVGAINRIRGAAYAASVKGRLGDGGA